MIADAPVDRSAHWIDHQPPVHRGLLDSRVQLVRRIEDLFGLAIGDEFDRLEQTAPANVADVRVIDEALHQALTQSLSLLANALEEVVAANHPLHGKRRGARRGVADVGMAVLEEAGAARNGVDDPRLHQHGSDRLVATAQSLGDRHQVGGDPFLLAGVQGAGTAHPAHHLVEHQQDAVAVAQLAHPAHVPRRRGERTRRGAADGFRDEGDHILATQAVDRIGEFAHQALAVLDIAFAGQAVTILVGRRYVFDIDQQGRELCASPRVATDRQRAQGVAVRPGCCRGSSGGGR